MSDPVKLDDRDKDIPFVDLREGARGIVTWAQMDGNKLADVALELIGEARRLTEKLDEDSRIVTSVIIGQNSSIYKETLIHHGADVVYVIEDDRLSDYLTLPFTRALISAIKAIKPEIAIFPATTLGRDLAPRVSALLNIGLSADCTELDVGYYVNRKKNQKFAKAFKMIRPSFGESKLATIIGPWNYPQAATVRPGIFHALPNDLTRTGKIVDFRISWEKNDFAVEILEVVRNNEDIDLSKANIIVAGGFGIGKDGFEQIKLLVSEFKEKGLNAELGASRAAVNAGFVHQKHQIGQTGKSARPSIYFAIGISGAIQHVIGMKASSKVIAINIDPTANIYKYADYGVVGDYKEAIPELIKLVKEDYFN